MFEKVLCPECKKKFSKKKMLSWNSDNLQYCPKCFEKIANNYAANSLESRRKMAEDNLTLVKRLKNKGTRMWVIIPIRDKNTVKSGLIRNRTEDEVGLRFSDEEVLQEFDEAADEITLFYGWNKVFLDEFSANIELEKIQNGEEN